MQHDNIIKSEKLSFDVYIVYNNNIIRNIVSFSILINAIHKKSRIKQNSNYKNNAKQNFLNHFNRVNNILIS